MPAQKKSTPCTVCNPSEAKRGDFCDTHREELHRLDHRYEAFFRLQRTSRGKDHETYHVFIQGECAPYGRILVTETDPENLSLTVLVLGDLDLDERIAEYEALGIVRTFGDQLRERIEQEIIHSWYGNARACVDVFRTAADQPQHWDVAPREEPSEEEPLEPHPPGGDKHSVH